MVPVTSDVSELDFTKKITDKVYDEVCTKFGVKAIDYKYGTMMRYRVPVCSPPYGQILRILPLLEPTISPRMSFGFQS